MSSHNCNIFLTILCVLSAYSYIDDAFNDRFTTTVAVPYLNSVELYFRVLDHIASELSELDQNSVVPAEVSKEFIDATTQFADQLSTAKVNSESVHAWAEYELGAQIGRIKNISNHIDSNNDAIFSLETSINQQKHKERSARLQLHAKQQLVSATLERVRQLEQEFYKARHRCMASAKRRRRRRDIGKSIRDWFKNAAITVKEGFEKIPAVAEDAGNLIYRGFCEFLNLFTKRIRRAKEEFEASEANLATAVDNLNEITIEIEFAKKGLKNLTETAETLQQSLVELGDKRHELRTTLNLIVSLENKMQRCVATLHEINTRARSISQVAQFGVILQPEKLIQPAIEIGQLIMKIDANSALPALSPENISQLVEKLERLDPNRV